jgi:O-antigen/teichoic acid export membrane protein
MHRHWQAIQWASIVVVVFCIVSVIVGKHTLAHGLFVSAVVFGTAYLIAVAQFQDRSGRGNHK